jgi:hypothetical protein
MSRIVIAGLGYHRHTPIVSIHLFGSYRRLNVFPVRCLQNYRVEFSIKERTMDNVKNCDGCLLTKIHCGPPVVRTLTQL